MQTGVRKRGAFPRSWLIGSLAWALFAGCQSTGDTPGVEARLSDYRERMLSVSGQRRDPAAELAAQPVPWQADLPPKRALLTPPVPTSQPAPDEVLAEIPDPSEALDVFRARLEALRASPKPDARVIRNYEEVIESAAQYLAEVQRPKQVRMSLADCIQRALAHNYAIRYESYQPAISQAQLVEAEAAFDAEFFLDTTFSKMDQPTASAFIAGQSDTRMIEGGLRKLLPTGMQVSVSLNAQRQDTNFPPEFQSLNPEYTNRFVVAFTQPLLRNFGLEVNRAQIKIRRAERDIAYEQFVQQVRDTLFEVEQTYWQLLQARRVAAILAESVAQNRVTYLGLWARRHHDATPVELTNSESRWRTREVEFREAVKTVRDLEDQLKNLLNDPELTLAEEVEIIPTETPRVTALTLDQLAAVRTALEQRSEIRQSRRAIDQARINTAVAKNQTLPKLDLTFQYEVNGLGQSADHSFDVLTTNRFISYTVRAEFAYPIGNRGPRAALRRARLQESQALVALYRVMDSIVQEVNSAVRTLMVRLGQIPIQLQAVYAADKNLQSYQARTQRIDPLFLENELNSVERLAQARQTLLQVVTDYNIAIAALQKAQGTLLEYNNIVVTDAPPE